MFTYGLTRKALFVALAFTLALPLQAQAYNKSWDQGHNCVEVNGPGKGWGRYGYDTTSPAHYRGGQYSSKDCCELFCKLCPVYANTGRLQKTFADITIPGVGPSLTVTRTYLSQDWANTLLGRGWMFNFGKRLIVTRDSAGEKMVVVRQEGGETNFFKENPGGTLELLAEYGVTYQFTKNPDTTYTIAEKNGTVQHIDAEGNLLEIFDKNGNRLSFTYDAVGCLSRITNASGNYVDFVLGPSGKIASISDNLGRTIQYAYDTNGNLISSTDPMGNATHYAYDSQNRLTSIVDPRGNTVLAVTYDSFQPPRIATFTEKGETWTITYFSDHTVKRHPSGRTWMYYFNDLGIIERVIDPVGNTTQRHHNRVTATSVEWEEDSGGHRTTYTWDAMGNITSKTDPMGNTWQYTYISGTERVETETDPLGVVTRYEYDTNGNQTKVIRDFGGSLQNTTMYTYDANGTLTSVTDALGNRTVFEYDAGGNLTRVTDPLGSNTSYTYDAFGNILSITGPNGDITRFEYDALRRVVRAVDALGQEERFSYDGAGPLSQHIDKLGRTWSSSYDSVGLPAGITGPSNSSLTWNYDTFGNLLSEVDAAGNRTTYVYDLAGNMTKLTSPSGAETSYSYDSTGRVVQQRDANGGTTTYEYDGGGRLTRVTDALGGQTLYTYDAAGRRVSVSVPGGQVVTIGYDSLGQPVRMRDSSGTELNREYDGRGNVVRHTRSTGQVTELGYDAANHLTRIRYPGGSLVRFEYDGAGNRTAIVDPKGARWAFTFDRLNQLVSTTDPLGRARAYTYDAGNRLVRESLPSGVESTTAYQSTTTGDIVTTTWPGGFFSRRTMDVLGRVAQVSSPINSIAYSYDSEGRVAQVEDTTRGIAVTYAYDPVGRLTSVASPGTSGTTNYTYDALGRPTSIVNGDLQVTVERDAAGKMLKKKAEGLMTIEYSYDGAGRQNAIVYKEPGGGIVDSFTYVFDSQGNVGQIQYHNGDTVAYECDADSQLLREHRTGAVAFDITYSYDAAGNRTRMVADGIATDYTYDAANQLLQSTTPIATTDFQYDESGRLVARHRGSETETFQYDPLGSLLQIAGPSVQASFEYDALGRRIRRTINGTTDSSVYDKLGVLQVLDSEAREKGSYVSALGLLATRTGGSTYGYIVDATGSVHGVMDGGGTRNSYAYTAFGETRMEQESVFNPLTFTGTVYDKEVGLNYLWARYYDPHAGRFLRIDPVSNEILLYGSPPTQSALFTNMYLYATNNPSGHIDPTGLWPKSVHEGDTTRLARSLGFTGNFGLFGWFGPDAGAVIGAADNAVDTDSSTGDFLGAGLFGGGPTNYALGWHFDIPGETTRMEKHRALRRSAEALCRSPEETPRAQVRQALELLGKSLHPLQDWYAHRDWNPGPFATKAECLVANSEAPDYAWFSCNVHLSNGYFSIHPHYYDDSGDARRSGLYNSALAHTTSVLRSFQSAVAGTCCEKYVNPNTASNLVLKCCP